MWQLYQDYTESMASTAERKNTSLTCKWYGGTSDKPQYTVCLEKNLLALWGGQYAPVFGSSKNAYQIPLLDWKGIEENVKSLAPELNIFGYMENGRYINVYGIPPSILFGIILLVLLGYVHKTEKRNSFIKIQLLKEREKERLFLAQELHDGPLQELQQIKFLLESTQTERDTALNQQLENRLLPIAQNLRTICTNLRPPTLSALGLDKALESLAFQITTEYGVECHPILEHEDLRLPEFERLVFYRTAQESIQNAIKHAKPHHIWIRLTFANQEVVLEVQNDGQGFVVPSNMDKLAQTGHYGLLGIQERVRAIGGILHIHSDLQEGTIIRLKLTLPKSVSKQTFLSL